MVRGLEGSSSVARPVEMKGEGEQGDGGEEGDCGGGVAVVVGGEGVNPDILSGRGFEGGGVVAGVAGGPPCVWGERRVLSPRGRCWRASRARSRGGDPRVRTRVLGCSDPSVRSPWRIWTTPAARSMSPCSSANSSEGRSPVAGAEDIGPEVGPSGRGGDGFCSGPGRAVVPEGAGGVWQHVGGVFSVRLQEDRRFKHWPRPWSARKGALGERGAPTQAVKRDSPSGTSPSAAVAFPSSQRSFATVTRSP